MHRDIELPLSFAISSRLTAILPLPAGEGWGEGESFERECRTVHGEGEPFERECRAVHGEGEPFDCGAHMLEDFFFETFRPTKPEPERRHGAAP
jgi:hypothetical protein